MPKARENKVSCKNYRSEIEVAVEIISGKWMVLLISHLGEKEVVRFNEFRKMFPDITQKMLTQQLKRLEETKIVKKKTYNQLPPKVEYRLSEDGKKLLPILEQMQFWGKTYIQNFKK